MTSMSQTRRTSQQKARLTIGFLTSFGVTNSYIGPIWQGILDAAETHDVNLICFNGREPLRIDEPLYNPAVFAQVSAANLDGLIVLYMTFPEALCQLDGYGELPMVSIAAVHDEFPSVVVDNREGVRAAIAHLIEAHGYRRIVFIQGPEGNPDADARYEAYIETLAEYRLPLDPDLVLPCYFTFETGQEAIRVLLEERRVACEAIVAANDLSALGVMTALQERSIQVPYDMAVVGFDDIEMASISIPPLTTVRQPLSDLGGRALELVLAQIRDETVPAQTILPVELVMRQSCGCFPDAGLPAAGPEEDRPARLTAPDEGDLHSLIARRPQTLATMKLTLSALESGVSEDWAERLLDALIEKLDDRRSDSFLVTLDLLSRQVSAGDVSAVSQVLFKLRHQVKLALAGNPSALSQAEDLWCQSQVFLKEAVLRRQAQQHVQTENRNEALRQLEAELIITFDLEELMEVLAQGLRQLGIPACYLALYEDPGRITERSRLILAYHEGERVSVDAEGQYFPTREVVPVDLLLSERRYSLLLKPLYFQKEWLGVVLFEVGPREGSIYEALRGQLSTALKGALVLQEHKQAEEALARQAQELARSNAELEQFAYVASHDLQEPLRMVKSYLQLIERRYEGQLDEDADDFIAFAVDGAERMQALINDLLQYSRVTTHGKPFAPTDCAAVLDHALDNLKVTIEESGAVVTHDSLPTVLADDVQLTQLLQNLIGNAIKFHKPDTPPQVHVGVARKDGEWLFSVQDNGISIAPEHFERIFMIFQRLHTQEEYEGTGIGLAVCKRIVERHGGRIWVESEPGKGSTFYFTITE
jgi:DNA-binding LacI/PurR family transcriptional regulator/signal transduction histidine kinase